MRQTARTAGSVAVLALLVGACVFAALTGPAVSLRTRTQALSQTLAAASPTTKSVQVDAPWEEFTSYLNTGNQGFEGIGGSANLSPAQFAETQREIGRGLARLPVPLGAGAWSGLTTRLLPVAAGAGPRTFTGTPPQLEFVYRNTLPANAQLVAGSYSHGALPRGALARGRHHADGRAVRAASRLSPRAEHPGRSGQDRHHRDRADTRGDLVFLGQGQHGRPAQPHRVDDAADRVLGRRGLRGP